jgi:hypothetical protein
MVSTDTAPDFNRSGYPSGGERLGPAWQQMWDALADGEWRTAGELASQPGLPIAPRTCSNLLAMAAARHLIRKRTRTINTRWTNQYRRVVDGVTTGNES